MKIIYVGHTNDWHGSSKALYNIVNSLKLRHKIYVVLPNSKGILSDKLREINVDVINLDYMLEVATTSVPLIFQINHICKSYRSFKAAKKKFVELLKEINPDIVHCNVGPISFPSDVCKELNIPLVWHLREYQDKDFGMRFIPSRKTFLKKLSNKNNTILAITKDIFNYWQLDSSKDFVLYDGVFSKKTELQTIPKSNYFLFVGRVAESKGTLEIIESFKEFSELNQNYRLLIAGKHSPKKSPYALKCQEFVEKNKLKNNVLFLGERTDIYELMSGAIALIVASKSEGFGFITVEGMLNKTIIIGRNCGGTKEQFDNGLEWSGGEIALRYSTKEELKNCMINAIKEKHEQMIENAYDVVWNHYSIEYHVDQLEKIYYSILKK